jgi:predicted aminopeptidase
MRLLRAFGLASACLVASALLSSCYETSEGLKYLSIISKAESIDSALADPATGPDLRLLLQRAKGARAFALENFGLKQTRNYTRVVLLKADRLATVVQACAELSFTRYLWSYPVVGKMPYRGYFDPEDAKKEAAALKKQGLDVIARPVDAFSTLGWFADPLFSFMSTYSQAEVADLVMHEMTHATIFLKGDRPGNDQFNEELATFVGDEGSLVYLSRLYGPDSSEVASARAGRSDEAAFEAFLEGTGKQLETLYSSSLSDDDKRKRKAEIIAERAAEFKKEAPSLFKGPGYADFDMGSINNAYIDLYRLYQGESPLYRDFYERLCGSDMRTFIQKVGGIAASKADPKAEMRRLLAATGSEQR